MEQRFKDLYMDIAMRVSQMSRAERLQVGCILVKQDRIISMSWNGTPAGWDNVCEDKVYMDFDAGGWLSCEEVEEKWPLEDYIGRYYLKTRTEVLHAESNCISKLARSSESGLGSVMFITHAPCIDCAKLIYQSGILAVYYVNEYRAQDGVDFLIKFGIQVEQLPINIT
jgi:dCMP deaminase